VAGQDLVGSWDDHELYQGSMEANDLRFNADGTGWARWQNALASSTRFFHWVLLAEGRLAIHTDRLVQDPAPGRTLTPEDLGQPDLIDYTIEPGHNVFSQPRDILRLSRKLALGDRFARVPGELLVPPAGSDPA
jgi:hypothetical protein